jgi:hypothetical protein
MIPLLLSDSRQMVEYKIWLDRKTTDESEALSLLEDYRDYYAGKHALLLSDDQKAFLEGIITSSEHYPVDNKCRVVVDRLRALLDVEGVEGGGEAVRLEQAEEMGSSPAGMMATWWRANHMNRWEKELYRFSLRDGEAYVMSWHDGTRPRMTVHQMWDGDTGVRMFYEDPDTKTTPMYASRHWYYADPVGEVQGVKRVTVYTSNGVFKYVGMVSEEQRRRMTAAGFGFMGSMTDDGLQALMDPGDPGWPLAWVDRQGRPLGLAVAPFVCPGGSVLAGLIGLNWPTSRGLARSWCSMTCCRRCRTIRHRTVTGWGCGREGFSRRRARCQSCRPMTWAACWPPHSIGQRPLPATRFCRCMHSSRSLARCPPAWRWRFWSLARLTGPRR